MVYIKSIHVVNISALKMKIIFTNDSGRGAMVQWLKLPAWKVGDSGFELRSGIQVSKKQNVSSLLTRENSILWRVSVTEKGSNFEPRVWRTVSSHLSLTILSRYSCPSLAYMRTKVAQRVLGYLWLLEALLVRF